MVVGPLLCTLYVDSETKDIAEHVETNSNHLNVRAKALSGTLVFLPLATKAGSDVALHRCFRVVHIFTYVF